MEIKFIENKEGDTKLKKKHPKQGEKNHAKWLIERRRENKKIKKWEIF